MEQKSLAIVQNNSIWTRTCRQNLIVFMPVEWEQNGRMEFKLIFYTPLPLAFRFPQSGVTECDPHGDAPFKGSYSLTRDIVRRCRAFDPCWRERPSMDLNVHIWPFWSLKSLRCRSCTWKILAKCDRNQMSGWWPNTRSYVACVGGVNIVFLSCQNYIYGWEKFLMTAWHAKNGKNKKHN